MDTDTTLDMKSETWLLRHGHWQVEVMANLNQVPATGALIVIAWAKRKDGLGFPARAFAILP
jgi:kynurenine formamidase